MPTQNTASLRDIHLPDAISWWPPAPAWWILLVLLVITFILSVKLYKKLTFTPLQKVALATFSDIVTQYHKTHDPADFIIQLSKFLRQTAMSYYGREEVAQLTGEKWIQCLNELSDKNSFSAEIAQTLMNAPYQKNMSVKIEPLIDSVEQWLNDLPKQPRGLNK